MTPPLANGKEKYQGTLLRWPRRWVGSFWGKIRGESHIRGRESYAAKTRFLGLHFCHRQQCMGVTSISWT